MKKNTIYIAIVSLILLFVTGIVAYPEVTKLREERDRLEKKYKRLGIQYYPDREVGNPLNKEVYFYANFLMEIEGRPFRGPILILCKSTDCFSQSVYNADVSIMKWWSFDPNDDESQKKAFFEAIDAIKSDHPAETYNIWLIFLTYYGQISNKQLWPLNPYGPFNDKHY